ncbi:hypothetical protein Ancab_035120 [Ancistrocladus abbreviatus]
MPTSYAYSTCYTLELLFSVKAGTLSPLLRMEVDPGTAFILAGPSASFKRRRLDLLMDLIHYRMDRRN